LVVAACPASINGGKPGDYGWFGPVVD